MVSPLLGLAGQTLVSRSRPSTPSSVGKPEAPVSSRKLSDPAVTKFQVRDLKDRDSTRRTTLSSEEDTMTEAVSFDRRHGAAAKAGSGDGARRRPGSATTPPTFLANSPRPEESPRAATEVPGKASYPSSPAGTPSKSAASSSPPAAPAAATPAKETPLASPAAASSCASPASDAKVVPAVRVSEVQQAKEEAERPEGASREDAPAPVPKRKVSIVSEPIKAERLSLLSAEPLVIHSAPGSELPSPAGSRRPSKDSETGVQAKAQDDEGLALRRGKNRRRLTVDTKKRLIGDLIEKEVASADGAADAPCRSKQHPAAAAQTPGMVLSVWGKECQDEDRFVPYFTRKGINFDGEITSLQHRIGLISHRGFKPESPNQDDFFVLARPESLLIGVMDGHGPLGHEVAHFAQERLPTILTGHLRKDSEAWGEAVRNSVEELVLAASTDLDGKGEESGCTVSVCLLDQDVRGRWRLRCGWLGDSIAVHASRNGAKGSWEVNTLVDIHRPDRDDELKRIKAAGGEVMVSDCPTIPSRLVTPEWNLAMSRSFGDFTAVPHGLSQEPELSSTLELDEDLQHLVIIASDGIWDVIPPAQAVAFVGKFRPEEAQLAAERLVSKAQLRWQEMDDCVDDITAIIVWPHVKEADD